MKAFHISDVLSATTGRLVSNRHMQGLYDIFNFLTGDELYTHQLPRAFDECRPWLENQFPKLTESALADQLAEMDRRIATVPKTREAVGPVVDAWVEELRVALGLPEMIPVYELPADWHTRIDPMEEARAMVGDDRVIGISLDETEPR